MAREILKALVELERQAGIPGDEALAVTEAALLAAWRDHEEVAPLALVYLDEKAGKFFLKQAFRYHPETPWSDVEPEDIIEQELDLDSGPGRAGAERARQALLNAVMKKKQEQAVQRYGGTVGALVDGMVDQIDRHRAVIRDGDVMMILPRSEMVPGEFLRKHARISVIIVSAEPTADGTLDLIVSRRDPRLVEELLAEWVPEVESGLIHIEGIARDPGVRCKVLARSTEDGVNIHLALHGDHRMRSRKVQEGLGGKERLDLIVWNENPEILFSKVLAPARIRSVKFDEETKTAKVQMSALEMEKLGEGNLELAEELTGWIIEIEPLTTPESGKVQRPVSQIERDGRCAHRNANDKRCVNHPLPGQQYCSLHGKS